MFSSVPFIVLCKENVTKLTLGTMASLIALSEMNNVKPQYYDKTSGLTREQYLKLIETTTTVYLGNLHPKTTESTIYSVFSDCGPINRVIMGVNRNTKEPCGFCFIEFFDRQSALNAVDENRFMIDGNQVRADLDRGFEEGRQYGRGLNGGQVRNEANRRNFQNSGPRRHNPRMRRH